MSIPSVRSANISGIPPYNKVVRSNQVASAASPGGPDDEINALMQETQLPPTQPQSNNSNNNLVTPTLNNQDTKGKGNFVTQIWDKAKSFVDKLPNIVKIGAGALGTLVVGLVAYKSLENGASQLFRRTAPLGNSELRQSKRNMQGLRKELKEANDQHKALEAANPNTDYHWTDWFNPFWTDKGLKFIDSKAARKNIEQNQEQLKKTSEKYHQAYLENKELATKAMVEKRQQIVITHRQRLKEAEAALKPIIEKGKEPKNDHAQLALNLAESRLKASKARLKQAREIHQTAKRENNNGFSPSDISVSPEGLTWRGVFANDSDLKADVKHNTEHNLEHKLINAYGISQDILAWEINGKWNPASGIMKIAEPNWLEKIGFRKYKPWTKPLEVLSTT